METVEDGKDEKIKTKFKKSCFNWQRATLGGGGGGADIEASAALI